MVVDLINEIRLFMHKRNIAQEQHMEMERSKYETVYEGAKIMDFEFKTRNCVSKSQTNEELCIKNEESCIKNDESCSRTDG